MSNTNSYHSPSSSNARQRQSLHISALFQTHRQATNSTRWCHSTARMASTTVAQPLPTKGCAKPLINLLRGMHTVRLPEAATKLIGLFRKAGRTHPSFLLNFYEPQQITSCQIALSLFQASNTAQTGATSFCVNLSRNGWMGSILCLNPLMWGESQSLEALVRIWRVYCRHSRIQDIQEIYGS